MDSRATAGNARERGAGSSARSRLLHRIEQLAAPLRVAIGLAALAVGAALFLAPMSVQAIALVTGLGFVLAGLAAALIPQPAARVSLPARVLGLVLAALGIVIAVWPSLGAPWLAFLIGAALVVHGLVGAWQAVLGSRDHRVAGLLAAAAGITVGALVFSWPVLTLMLFRFGVAAWFAFFGLQLILALLLRPREPRRQPRTGIPSRPVLRNWTRTVAAVLSLALALLLASGSVRLLSGVPLPDPGPFYSAPAEIPDEPGQLLRSEELTAGVPSGARGWRILYTTTLSDGTAAISSGTILAPADPPAEPLPLLTVAHGTTGVVPKCAPSLSPTPFADGAETALEEMVTRHGWVAVTSDYVGLGTEGTHPYLVGDAEARNVLDASRAAQQFREISTTTDTVVWGHSQGGQAALWTGQLAESYAPEFTIKGVAAFAPATDLFGLAEVDKTEIAGKTVSAYIATTWNRLYPDLRLEKNLTPGSAGPVGRIDDLCFNGKDVLSALTRGSQIPNQIFPDRLLDGAFGERLKEQAPVGPFPAPVMVAQGLSDPLVKPRLQKDWVQARCKAGDPIDYRTFPGLGHMNLVAADSPLTPQIVKWTLDRWEGAPPTPSCGAG